MNCLDSKFPEISHSLTYMTALLGHVNAASRKSLAIQAYSFTKPRTLLKRKFVWKLVFSCSNASWKQNLGSIDGFFSLNFSDVMWKPTICPAAVKGLHQAIRKTENESAVSLLLLWETNRGKYVFFGLIIRFVTFQSPLRLPSNLDCPKTCLWVTRCFSRNFRRVETASTLVYAQETTNAQLRSHSCFPDRLLILNEDRILSDGYKKGFRKTLLIFHYFPILNKDRIFWGGLRLCREFTFTRLEALQNEVWKWKRCILVIALGK